MIYSDNAVEGSNRGVSGFGGLLLVLLVGVVFHAPVLAGECTRALPSLTVHVDNDTTEESIRTFMETSGLELDYIKSGTTTVWVAYERGSKLLFRIKGDPLVKWTRGQNDPSTDPDPGKGFAIVLFDDKVTDAYVLQLFDSAPGVYIKRSFKRAPREVRVNVPTGDAGLWLERLTAQPFVVAAEQDCTSRFQITCELLGGELHRKERFATCRFPPPVVALDEVLSDRRQECKRVDGKWTHFSSTCVDTCSFVVPTICGQAITQACSCGPDRCWYQGTCIDNPKWHHKHNPYANIGQEPESAEGFPVTVNPANPELGPDMARIEGGCFDMGSPKSEPDRRFDETLHQVCVQTFGIGKYEVTIDAYDRFAEATGRKFPYDEGWGRGERPVIHVSWNDVSAYAQWLSAETGISYRLPTEAEWEYAARTGADTAYPWGDEVGQGHANCNGCGSRWDYTKTAPVGSFAPNEWGLHAMAGNVWEWTCSRYEKRYGGDENVCSSPKGPGYRVNRGGSWTNEPSLLRSATRSRDLPGSGGYNLGFRLAQDL